MNILVDEFASKPPPPTITKPVFLIGVIENNQVNIAFFQTSVLAIVMRHTF